MHRATLALIPAVALIMAGCAAAPKSEPQPAPAPEPVVNAAEAPCNEFSALSARVADLVIKIWTEESEPGDEAELESTGAKFDTMALQAEGVVGERISEVAEIVLATSPIVMSLEPDGYFAALESVQRACAAEDVEIGIGTWS